MEFLKEYGSDLIVLALVILELWRASTGRKDMQAKALTAALGSLDAMRRRQDDTEKSLSKERYSAAALKIELGNVREELLDLRRAYDEKAKEVDRLTILSDIQARDLNKLREDNAGLASRVISLESERDRLRLERDALSEERDKLSREAKLLAARRDGLEARVAELEREVETLKRKTETKPAETKESKE